MDLSHQIQLQEMIRHSYTMLEKAEAGEWEFVMKYEPMRRRMIENYFGDAASSPVSDKETQHTATAIKEMLEVNSRIQGLADQERDSISSDASAAQQARRAVRAYTETES